MGRKRRLPALAREKAVAEEVASARESEQKVAALKAKPNDALFVIDAAGEERPMLAAPYCCAAIMLTGDHSRERRRSVKHLLVLLIAAPHRMA